MSSWKTKDTVLVLDTSGSSEPTQAVADTEMSSISTNAVQNKVIKNYVDKKDSIKTVVMVGSQSQIEDTHQITFNSNGKPIYKYTDNASSVPKTTQKKLVTETDIESLTNLEIEEILKK